MVSYCKNKELKVSLNIPKIYLLLLKINLNLLFDVIKIPFSLGMLT